MLASFTIRSDLLIPDLKKYPNGMDRNKKKAIETYNGNNIESPEKGPIAEKDRTERAVRIS